MMFKLREAPATIVRPRVTPDPNHAAELQRRISALAYVPQNGFHRDHHQRRHDRMEMRLGPR
jgi:hypothetical protein